MKPIFRVFVVSGLLWAILGTGCSAQATSVIAKIYDGDTVTLNTGERVRLLQMDTPELSPLECHATESRLALAKLLSSPGTLSLRTDPSLDKIDKYGRLLRYLFKGDLNVNLKMVEIGAAAPYFYRSERGLYAEKFLAAAHTAKKKSLGLWQKCPGTVLTPNNSLQTTLTLVSQLALTGGVSCDPNYEGCIPISASDLDCADIKQLGLAPVRVIGRDVHKLDRDGDEIGCDK
jgi:endonuclease YncB( thermonuclease family)